MSDVWKFPGAGGEGNAMDDALAAVGLWDERESIAKRLYARAGKNAATVPWERLREDFRKVWRKKAEGEMK